MERIDALDYVSKLFERAYDKSLPCDGAAGAGMARFTSARISLGGICGRAWLDRLNTRPMIRLLKRVQPHLCVATHFLPAEMIAWLIAKKKLRAHNAIGDYDVHAMWLCRTVDRHYVALEEAAEHLAHVGVRREKLRVTGIPNAGMGSAPSSSW